MSSPTPVQSFLGGIGIVVPIQFLLTLNGSVFGISGFLHSAVQGGLEPLTSVAGLLVGGIIIGAVERTGPQTISAGLLQIAFSGLLVGIGSKVWDSPFLPTIAHFCFGHTAVRWLYLWVSTGYVRVLSNPFT